MSRILTPWRLRVYPRLLLAAMALAVAFTLATGQGARIVSGRLGGDFAEFYAAGRLLANAPRSAAGLYDPARQRAAQADLMPDGQAVFVPFAYPPQFALPYALLTVLPYPAAFAAHLAAMGGLLFLAVALACRESARTRGYVPAVFCAAVLFYPIFRALLGGQNTPLTLALAAGAWALERRGRPVLAGLCLAALCYKPQFGLGLLGLYFLAGRWRMVLAGLAGAALVFAGNTVIFGPDWATRWFTYAHWVVSTSLAMEGEKAISFIGVCRALLWASPQAALFLGYGLALATAVLCGAAFWTLRGRPVGLAHLGLAGAGLVLVAPHAYYYDAGLLFFGGLALLDSGRRQAPAWVLGLWLAGLAQAVAWPLGLSPLFPAALACFWLCLVPFPGRPGRHAPVAGPAPGSDRP
uniref:Uncharacterized protein n=1 Tax=Desulfovibrio sp. U5L TaxID=596152 RepID=I2Q187_9BACT